MILIPIRTKGGLNSREHWRARTKRVRQERDAVALILASHERPQTPLSVFLTRLGPSNGLDDDNLAGSLKAIRDELAAWFGVDDKKRDVIRYQYEQERAKEWGVRIDFAPHPDTLRARMVAAGVPSLAELTERFKWPEDVPEVSGAMPKPQKRKATA